MAKSIVISKEMWTPQSFLAQLTGNTICFDGYDDELRDILDENGFSNLWDYPLDEIDEAIESGMPVVLVETSYLNDDYEIVPEYRWFQVPEDFLRREVR